MGPTPHRQPPEPPVLAAGALLWRPGPDGPEVALVHRPRYDDWSLPKGKLDKGETLPEAAVREVREETGYAVTLGRPLPDQRYPVTGADGVVREKLVRWWVARPPADGAEAADGADGDGPNSRPPSRRPVPRPADGTEIDAVEWVPVEEVPARASRPADAALVATWRAAPGPTTAVLLLRHANAVARRGWDRPDDERPLTPRGQVQALALPGLLAAFGATRLVSSPAVRCAATLAPYARGTRGPGLPAVPVELDAAFGTTDPERAGPALLALLADLDAGASGPRDAGGLGRPGGVVVVCTHRPTLDPLLAALAGRCDAALPIGRLAKAGLHVLHSAAGRVLAIETHEQGRHRTAGAAAD